LLTKEIETWLGFIDKLPTDDDKVVLTKLLDSCYKYSVAMNSHVQTHPFPPESLIQICQFPVLMDSVTRLTSVTPNPPVINAPTIATSFLTSTSFRLGTTVGLGHILLVGREFQLMDQIIASMITIFAIGLLFVLKARRTSKRKMGIGSRYRALV
jgi:hypothetical protein